MEQLDVIALLHAAQMLERNVTVSLMYSGLRIWQYRLLEALSLTGQSTVTEMSKKLHVTRASASAMIAELINADIVAVVDNPSDRRSFHVRLTDLGRDKLNVARRDLGVLQSQISKQYPAEMLEMLNAFARLMP